MSAKSTKNTAEQLRRRLELRGSGGHGTHGDRRTKRARTRSAQKRAAVGEQG